MLELKPAAEPVDLGRHHVPFAWRIKLGMHDDVAHLEARQFVEAGLVREVAEQNIQPIVQRRPDAAVAVHRLLPVPRRMQHVHRLAPLEGTGLQRVGQGDLGDGERPGPAGEPAVGERDVHAVRRDRERDRRELRHEQQRRRGGEHTRPPGASRAARRSNPAPATIARPSTASIVNRDGTRMKLMPGSQYTSGHSPNGGPIDSHALTSARMP